MSYPDFMDLDAQHSELYRVMRKLSSSIGDRAEAEGVPGYMRAEGYHLLVDAFQQVARAEPRIVLFSGDRFAAEYVFVRDSENIAKFYVCHKGLVYRDKHSFSSGSPIGEMGVKEVRDVIHKNAVFGILTSAAFRQS